MGLVQFAGQLLQQALGRDRGRLYRFKTYRVVPDLAFMGSSYAAR